MSPLHQPVGRLSRLVRLLIFACLFDLVVEPDRASFHNLVIGWEEATPEGHRGPFEPGG